MIAASSVTVNDYGMGGEECSTLSAPYCKALSTRLECFSTQPGPSTNRNHPLSNPYSKLPYLCFHPSPVPAQRLVLIMGRRQLKNGAGATIQYQVDIEIAPIVYTKQQLEYSKSTIATFANALINKNKPHGVEVSRRHVIALWTINVQRVYPVGEPKREELLGQVSTLRYTGLKYSVPLTKLHRLTALYFTSSGWRIPSLQHTKTGLEYSRKPHRA